MAVKTKRPRKPAKAKKSKPRVRPKGSANNRDKPAERAAGAVPDSWVTVQPKRFRALRESYGLTIEKAAAICGIAFSTWFRWESGKHVALGYKYAYALTFLKRWAKAHPTEAAALKRGKKTPPALRGV